MNINLNNYGFNKNINWKKCIKLNNCEFKPIYE